MDGWNMNEEILLSPGKCAGLRIHNETEKGDNETIKKGTGASPTSNACCGGASELARR